MDYEKYMREALQEAKKALVLGEVPVGAVVVLGDKIIGRGHNRKENDHDPTSHAEIIALREAAKRQKSWRLNGATLFVTLEPCPMCAGAMLQSRIERVVYGVDDPKAGAAGTLINLLQFPGFNHELKIVAGVLEKEAQELLQGFFSRMRKENKTSLSASKDVE